MKMRVEHAGTALHPGRSIRRHSRLTFGAGAWAPRVHVRGKHGVQHDEQDENRDEKRKRAKR